MKIFRYTIIAVFTIAAASCNNEKITEKSAETISEVTEKAYPVHTQKLAKQNIEKTLDYTANLIAYKEIHYAPASPGRVDNILVEIGTRVHKGQLLAETDKTQLSQAITQLKSAKSNFERVDTLYQLGSISEQAFDQAKTQYDLAQSNVDFLMDNTTLKSSINGIVTGKYFENGEFYSGAPNTPSGKAAIVSLMQINPMKALVSIPQSYFPLIKKGMTVNVETDMYPNSNFQASVYKIHPTIDQATRTFQVEVQVANPEEKLRPGMFANIFLKLENTKSLVVPAISVVKQAGTNNRYVFVNNKGKANQIQVSIGKRFDDKVEIISNEIGEGMELIVDGQANLINGSSIKVVENNEMSAKLSALPTDGKE
jgi:RND family efflux transporter MFP subunit